MGREIAAAVIADRACALVGCIEQPSHQSIGKDYGALTGLGISGCTVSAAPAGLPVGTSVIIDFSSRQATLGLLDALKGESARVVIGTTGFSDAEISLVRQSAQSIPIVLSPNMSYGVNLLFALTELAAQKLSDSFDIEIIEAHHRFKKDSPSGTARKLGEIAAHALGTSYDETVKNGRAGMVGERPQKEVGMHAVRGGDIVGDHTVLFAGLGERIELRHVAHSRGTFAHGAVAAAKWLASRQPGLYSMRDVLGI